MGEIRASVTLENRDDRGAVYLGLRVEADVRRTTVEGVVDTGAVSLVIPEEIATELGLRHWGTRTVVYADERRDERPVTDVTIEIGNLATRTEAIVGPAGSEVLIGQVLLEMLDLIADCRNRTLTPRHPEGPVLAIRQARTPRQPGAVHLHAVARVEHQSELGQPPRPGRSPRRPGSVQETAIS